MSQEKAYFKNEYLKDLLRYRELFYFLSLRDILVRYKQAFFGIAWALVRPILNMIVFTLLFSQIANLPSDGINYGLFVLAGMLPWQLFSNSLGDTSNSLVNSSNLVSKIYFPRILIPAAQITVHIVDFAIGIGLLTLLAFCTGSLSCLTIFALPTFVGLSILLCMGCGLWLSALTVEYRDFRFIIPFVVQFGMFISPVGYGTFVIPEKWKWFFFLNPMVGIIDGFRWSFFGTYHPYIFFSVGFSVIITIVLLVSGFLYFRKMERTFADRI